ncbi:hypothetical protein B0T18DRAFT_221997 [Schizothecium vesticola]|uniref:GET complex subunit GET2 n=1 Tax=Schizothecium vesticola TaxID=314040 RepID=A0AA40K051_9PEZI|nr:hypothetical protein B0T18DRAFT_221997 [Schizothecium vesticola]
MTETIDDAEARAEQARLARKERREAKIRAGGNSRLNKISGVGGGLQRSDEDMPALVNDDPEEVDISQHFYTPERRRPAAAAAAAGVGEGAVGAGMGGMGMGLDEAQLRALMLGGPQPAPGANPFAPGGGIGGAGADEDPMMRIMSQMLGGGAGGPGGASPFPFPLPGQPAMAVPNKSTSIWRLLHTALALGLGLYIALWTSFRGTKGERTLGSVGGEGEEETARKRFFYAFATAEAVLLTTRYFVDGGVSGGGGGEGCWGW